MKIVKLESYLNVEFSNPHIKKLQYDRKGNLAVTNQHNEEISHFCTVAEIVFNGQYEHLYLKTENMCILGHGKEVYSATH